MQNRYVHTNVLYLFFGACKVITIQHAKVGAWLTREEHHKGALAPGCLADLCVLDRDYFTCAEEEIKDIRVDITILHGAVAYERN